MKNIELSESLVKELFMNWLPRIWFTSVDSRSSNIARVVCDFWLIDCRKLNWILDKFNYQFDTKKFRGDVLDKINNIVGI